MSVDNIPEGKKTLTMSYWLLAYLVISLVIGTYSITTIYWNMTRVEDRLNKKTERLHDEIVKEVKNLEERIELKYEKKK